ncbi:hypothetical protein FA95DRAFT_1456977, partial [Auriscalpium vulgare]
DRLRLDIIREWQAFMALDRWKYVVCAACGQNKYAYEVSSVSFHELDLTLLVDVDLPDHLAPVSYDFALYSSALLHPRGLERLFARGNVTLCDGCERALEQGQKPVDAISNKMYYAIERLPPNVRRAFEESTLADRQLAAACRATQINYLLTASQGAVPGAAQRYSKGHVAMIPQDSCRIATVLPPASQDLDQAICVMFLGGEDRPTAETVRAFHPLLVSLQRVSLMINYLLAHNPYYREQGIVFSEHNLACLLRGDASFDGVGVPCSVEITHIPTGASAGAALSSRYDGGERDAVPIPPSELYLESIGYSSSTETLAVHSAMKGRALQWCLDRRPFLAVRRGQSLFTDRDPRMLSFCFPHLDPSGLGGFNHPARTGKYKISFLRQLKNMVLTADAPFAKDPVFIATVWDIHQRLQASTATQFQLKSGSYAEVVDVLRNSLPELDAMNKKWEGDPGAKPCSRKEKELVFAMNKLTLLSKNIMGSQGSKARMRHQVRAMLKTFGCPALYVTLNPSDINHRLLHVLCGGNPDTFHLLTAFERMKQVADNPVAAAKFFDVMMKAFIRIILRFGRSGKPGLFGV